MKDSNYCIPVAGYECGGLYRLVRKRIILREYNHHHLNTETNII